MGLKDVKGVLSTGLGDLLGDRMDSRMTPTLLPPVTEIANIGFRDACGLLKGRCTGSSYVHCAENLRATISGRNRDSEGI